MDPRLWPMTIIIPVNGMQLKLLAKFINKKDFGIEINGLDYMSYRYKAVVN